MSRLLALATVLAVITIATNHFAAWTATLIAFSLWFGLWLTNQLAPEPLADHRRWPVP